MAERRVGRVLGALSRGAALFGGALLLAMAAVTLGSVLGRALSDYGLTPLRGDFELVEIGTAIAVFAFLPWCQIGRGNVSVDILSRRLGARAHAALGCAGDLVLALCSGVILRQLWLGFAEKFPLGGPELRATFGLGPPPFFAETTYELQMPVWIPFGICLVLAALLFAVCMWSVWRSLNWTLAGREPVA
jgi:hypothetical protein